MDTRTLLLRAICERPFDVTVRLAFADYLDETGDANDADRAWFIRYDCDPDLTKWAKPDRSRSDRAMELFSKHYATWFPDTKCELVRNVHHYENGDYDQNFQRRDLYSKHALGLVGSGFLYSIRTNSVTAKDPTWITHLFRHNPITKFRLVGIDPSVTDREPGFKDYYCWPSSERSRVAFLGKFLKTGLDSWVDTKQEAWNNLSNAMVSWGRWLADLPELEFPEQKAK